MMLYYVDINKKTQLVRVGFFWIMSYKKDIFGSIAYEFELSQFLVKSFACAHGEIIYSVNCEI